MRFERSDRTPREMQCRRSKRLRADGAGRICGPVSGQSTEQPGVKYHSRGYPDEMTVGVPRGGPGYLQFLEQRLGVFQVRSVEALGDEL